MSLRDNYIFNLDEKVTRKSVSYKNRFGITIAADLYQPKDFDESQEYAAIIVGAPYGGVKEQGPGIYAQNMALRGFVALTFDPSFNGYSGGEPRHLSSPDIFVEDFSAAVDYLGTRPFRRPGAHRRDRHVRQRRPQPQRGAGRPAHQGGGAGRHVRPPPSLRRGLRELAHRRAAHPVHRRAPGAAVRGLRVGRAAPDPARRADRLRREHPPHRPRVRRVLLHASRLPPQLDHPVDDDEQPVVHELPAADAHRVDLAAADPVRHRGARALAVLQRGRLRARGRAQGALRRPQRRPRRPLRQDGPDPVRQAGGVLHGEPRTRRAGRRSTRRQRSLIYRDTQTRERELQLPPRSLATG